MIIPQIKIPQEERKKLGDAFVQRVEEAATARDRRMGNVYVKAMKNYEGKAKPRTFPWPNASKAKVDITSTHCDAMYARLQIATTTHDPVYLLRPQGDEDEVLGNLEEGTPVTLANYVAEWQRWSQWVEKYEVPNKTIMQEVNLLITKYGDAIAVPLWENQQVQDYELDPITGKYEKNPLPRDVYDRPVVHVIHPKNFYIPVEEHGPDAEQRSPWFAYDVEYDIMEIKALKKAKEWDSHAAEEILKYLQGAEQPKKSPKTYYQELGDGSVVSPDDFDRELRSQASVDEMPSRTRARMLWVWARIDLDEDGIPEEISLLVHRDTGHVAIIRYNPFAHKLRPAVHFFFFPRDGIFYNIGVAEMLFNTQSVLDTIVRDMLDNNKVQNTKMFLARKGGPIKQDMRAYPARVWMVDNIETDFKAVDMGTGKPTTSLQDMSFVQAWGERRTGIQDAFLGRESYSRTPATTTLANIEEGNKRIDTMIDGERQGQAKMWGMVLQLYAQKGVTEKMRTILGPKGARIMEVGLSLIPPEKMRDKLIINPDVSSQALNRSIMRQEAMALYGQVKVNYEQTMQIAQAISMTPDPTVRSLLILMAKALYKTMTQLLTTFDSQDVDDLNPNILEVMNAIQPGAIVPAPPSAAGGNQVDQALATFEGLGGTGGPPNPPGRPAAGLPRPPGNTELGAAATGAAG